jgi:hypothetical protein
MNLIFLPFILILDWELKFKENWSAVSKFSRSKGSILCQFYTV